MIGGTVIGITRGGTMRPEASALHLECGRDTHVTHCEDHGRVSLGDVVWCQSRWVLWTPMPKRGPICGVDYDVLLKRLDWPHGSPRLDRAAAKGADRG